ncbi:hypothetical protein NE237_003628 [Protea cynaroides]|uniref:Uncharacterized protein n=1 Tax=Protea cynaroides TaxID=273540 RepID=A0A9Q0QSX1_9MAGN|nr:hypothetical protein NE237_003628 [Protea cynaroides]
MPLCMRFRIRGPILKGLPRALDPRAAAVSHGGSSPITAGAVGRLPPRHVHLPDYSGWSFHDGFTTPRIICPLLCLIPSDRYCDLLRMVAGLQTIVKEDVAETSRLWQEYQYAVVRVEELERENQLAWARMEELKRVRAQVVELARAKAPTTEELMGDDPLSRVCGCRLRGSTTNKLGPTVSQDHRQGVDGCLLHVNESVG